MKVSTFATICPFMGFSSCRLVGFAVGMLKPHALFSALHAHHGKGTVGASEAAVIGLAGNKGSSHGFEEERLSPR